MNKKKIEEKIKSSFDVETPNFLAQIKAKCQTIEQEKPQIDSYEVISSEKSNNITAFIKGLALCLSFAFMFMLGFIVKDFGDGSITTSACENSIYLDVNPSIEIQLDKDNKVYDFVAINDDASVLLTEIDLKGVEVNTAIYAVVGLLYSNGYLSEENNSILVSIENFNEENVISLDSIASQISKVFENNTNMECSIIAQKLDTDQSKKDMANEYGVSVGKVDFANKIIDNNNLYNPSNFEELVNMTIQELNLIYQSGKPKPNPGNKDNEFVTGKPNGYIYEEDIINLVISEKNLSLDEIKYYYTNTIFNEKDSKRDMLYIVTIILNNDENLTYYVDCKTKEVIEHIDIPRWDDIIKDEIFDNFEDFFGNHFQGNNR